LLVEDVDDHVGIVDYDPLAHGVAVDGVRLHLVVELEAALDLAGDGLEVGLGGSAANDEKIGKAGDAAQIQGNDVFSLFIGSELRATSGEF